MGRRKWETPTAKGEKILKSRPGWRRTSEIKKLRIVMTVVVVVLAISVAAAAAIAWVTVDPLQFWAPESSAPPVSSETASSEPPEAPDVTRYDLTVVNNDAPVPEGFDPALEEVEGVPVAGRIAGPLRELLQAAREDGVELQLAGGYVPAEEQEQVYRARVEELEASGMTAVRAENEALSTVERGNCSERQLGYTVEFSPGDGAFGESPAYSWLLAHSLEYGFVQRYPDNKTEETGKPGSAVVFRFVGEKNAQRMRQLGMCLEEYAQYVAQQQKNNS